MREPLETTTRLDGYLRLAVSHISGHISGDLYGPVTVRGQEGTVAVLRYTHSLRTPFDAGNGGPSGLRQHGPLTITKAFDRTSPALRAAWAANATFSTWVLEIGRTEPRRRAFELSHRITLTQARIVSIDSSFAEGEDLEDVTFVYQRIQWRSETPTTPNEAADDWTPQPV